MNIESPAKKTSTLLRSLMAALAMVALSLGLAACGGPSPTQAAEQALEADLKLYSEADADELGDLLGSAFSGLESMGIDSSELIQAMKGKFSYSIDGAEQVSDDEVKLSVTTENVDIAQVLTNWASGAQSFAQEQVLAGNTDYEAIIKAYTQRLLDDLQASDAPMSSATNEITMEKDDDGNWDVADDGSVMQDVLFPGLSSFSPSSLAS